MNKTNITNLNIDTNLEIHSDERGWIADVFYNANINHVAFIHSVQGSVRGHHYHKLTTQHILITQGSLEYWWKTFGSDKPAQKVVCVVGDLITTPPYEIHALKIDDITGNQFIVFSEGQRGGKDYESDTFRVDPIF